MILTDIESGNVSLDLKPYDIVMEDYFWFLSSVLKIWALENCCSLRDFLAPTSMPVLPVRGHGLRWGLRPMV